MRIFLGKNWCSPITLIFSPDDCAFPHSLDPLTAVEALHHSLCFQSCVYAFLVHLRNCPDEWDTTPHTAGTCIALMPQHQHTSLVMHESRHHRRSEECTIGPRSKWRLLSCHWLPVAKNGHDSVTRASSSHTTEKESHSSGMLSAPCWFAMWTISTSNHSETDSRDSVWPKGASLANRC